MLRRPSLGARPVAYVIGFLPWKRESRLDWSGVWVGRSKMARHDQHVVFGHKIVRDFVG